MALLRSALNEKGFLIDQDSRAVKESMSINDIGVSVDIHSESRSPH
jgi:hypothetical protein